MNEHFGFFIVFKARNAIVLDISKDTLFIVNRLVHRVIFDTVNISFWFIKPVINSLRANNCTFSLNYDYANRPKVLYT
ncbi:hypothetical protein TUM4249_16530 [Shewanella sp. KT0246]|nr:hypothetical protein TUM4249_16530 [Shewanella sp. KT0246]